MNSANTLRTILLACGLGGAVASGCVITTGSTDCTVCDSSPLCHNQETVDADGNVQCVCDPGYTWENPADNSDFSCERTPSKPGASNCVEPNSTQVGDQCECDDLYVWCSDAPDDLTCCLDPAQETAAGSDTDASAGTATDTDDSAGTATDSDTDDTTDTEDTTTTGMNTPPPDEDCTEDGLRACSNTNPDDVQGSTAWTCLGGAWEELDLDEECAFSGQDFGYGCYASDDASVGVVVECGMGPGTACTDEQACADSEVLELCLWGKLTTVNCQAACEDPDAEITWELGECVAGRPDGCQCCDDPVDGMCDCGGDSTCEE